MPPHADAVIANDRPRAINIAWRTTELYRETRRCDSIEGIHVIVCMAAESNEDSRVALHAINRAADIVE